MAIYRHAGLVLINCYYFTFLLSAVPFLMLHNYWNVHGLAVFNIAHFSWPVKMSDQNQIERPFVLIDRPL